MEDIETKGIRAAAYIAIQLILISLATVSFTVALYGVLR